MVTDTSLQSNVPNYPTPFLAINLYRILLQYIFVKNQNRNILDYFSDSCCHHLSCSRLQPPSSCPDILPSFHRSALVQPGRAGLSGTADVYRLRRGELAGQRESGHRRDLDQHRSSAPRQDFPTQQPSVPSSL